jgi:CRP-like cAMP-binding protein
MDRFQVARFLRMQPWFAHISPAQQESVTRAAYTVRAGKGEVVLPAREQALGWYAVLWGFVKLQSPGQDQQASSFLALTGGEWFGEGSAMKDEPRRYQVVALRDSELLCLPRARFRELIATNLTFNHAVMKHLNLRLGQAMAIIETQRHCNLEQRLALHLSRTFWHGLRRLNLSQEELGLLAGMSRQAVNRTLKGLEQRGFVSLLNGRVVSVDQAAIERLLGKSEAANETVGAPAMAGREDPHGELALRLQS